MSKTIKCDICENQFGDITDHSKIKGILIDGAGRSSVIIAKPGYDEYEFDLLVYAVNSTGDRIEIDVCADCMAKGGAGFGGGSDLTEACKQLIKMATQDRTSSDYIVAESIYNKIKKAIIND